MAKIDDGGQAFPGNGIGRRGMSLRDWLAGQIAAGVEARDDGRRYVKGEAYSLEEWRKKCDADDAEHCYRKADAMIAARKKGK
jgi:hypothetical protein